MNLLISQATQLLSEGEVIAFPTETVYALACDATNPSAVKKLYEIKGRNFSQPIAVFVENAKKITDFAELSETAERISSYYMPGAITLILPLKQNHNLAHNLNKNNTTIGIRVPNHPLALNILAAYNHPIAATSANPSGSEPAKTATQIREYFDASIPLILDFSATSASGKASTVLDLSQSPPQILRKGEIGIEELGKLAGNIQDKKNN